MAWFPASRSRKIRPAHALTRTARPSGPAVETLEDRTAPAAVGWAIDAVTNTYNWGLAIDRSDNSILTGNFSGTTTIGSTTLASNAGSTDGYVAKYDATGTLVWARSFGGPGDDEARRVAADAAGYIYVAGFFSGTASFGPSITLTGSSYDNAFVAKMDPAGNFLWVQPFTSSTGNGVTWGVAVDASGNVYATGYFNGTTAFGNTTLTSAGGSDAFVAKLDASGNVVWAQRMGGSSDTEWGMGVGADPNGNVYVSGRFTGTASFGTLSLTADSPSGSNNGFVTRLDSSGNFQWAQRLGGDYNLGLDLALDTRAADSSMWAVYVTGEMSGTSCDFGPTRFTTGGDDAYVTKLDATTGSFTWADQLGGAGQDYGYAIAVDGSGNVYSTGTFGAFDQWTNFDPHGSFLMYPGNGAYASPGNGVPPGNIRDAYVSALDSNGNFLAAWQTRNSASNDGGDGKGIAADAAGNIFTAGEFQTPTLFPTGQTLTPTLNDNIQIYLMRLSAPHGAVVGTIYADLNDNGQRDAEPALKGWTAYADLNNNGQLDPGEPAGLSDLWGRYQVESLPPGTYTIRTVPPAGWTTSTPAGGAFSVTVGSGFARGYDFGEYAPNTQTTYGQSKTTTIKPGGTGQSMLSVSDSYSLLDVDVLVNISLPGGGTSGINLIAPDGTTVRLSGGGTFTNTDFDDEATTPIGNGSPPYTGRFQPQFPLAVLQGKNIKGTWTLQVSNGGPGTAKIASWSLIGTHTTNSPQLSGVGVAPGGEAAAAALTPAELAPIARAAVARWAAAGLTASQLALLNHMQYSIGNLSASGALGLTALNSPRVSLDATADGWGWFIDPTPASNSEFAVPAGGSELEARPGSPAFGHMDLLTVVEHELGHVLGLDDLAPGWAAHDLMTATLGLGARRFPDRTAGAQAAGGSDLALPQRAPSATGAFPAAVLLVTTETAAQPVSAGTTPSVTPAATTAPMLATVVAPAAHAVGGTAATGALWSPSRARWLAIADRLSADDQLFSAAMSLVG
jgi:subtilisin-like proprotein convertase family protein